MPIHLGPRQIEITAVEHFGEMQSMNDDVPAQDAEGHCRHHSMLRRQPSPFVHKWGSDRLRPSHIMFPVNWKRKCQETMTPVKSLQLRIKRCQLSKYLSGMRTCSGSTRK
jgi:hypothetical protein